MSNKSSRSNRLDSNVWIPPIHVPSINIHKNKKFVLERNFLRKYGYYDIKHLTPQERHEALDKALANGIEPIPLLRRINALFVLFKNRDPQLSAKFRADMDYIRHTKAYQNRSAR
jgi:hypothetical protein